MVKRSTEAAPEDIGSMLSPVSVGRTSELIVDQIRLLIRQGHLRLGDGLPAERALSERFGVSRVTVREALRILESAGLVEIRTGSRGGAFVTAPSSNRIGRGLTDLLTMSTLQAADVTEGRQIIELGVIPLACRRATEEDFLRLEELCLEAEHLVAAGTYSVAHSLQFHVHLAASAHNGAVDLLIQSFRAAMLDSLQEARDHAPEMGPVGLKEHKALVIALRQRDEDKGLEILTRHLARTATRVARTLTH
jgi:GntR family transcriptional regulator, transcriptional repressor for pyruvate dehydrogenase complex